MSDLHDRDPATGAGFTLIELVVVLAVLSILAGSLMPVVTAARDGERALLVELELERIATALEAYYGDHGRFPARLDVPEFRERYLEARVAFGGLVDDWSPTGAPYGYAGDADPDVVVVWSVGPDGVDDGGRREEVAVTVHGARLADTVQ